MNHLFSLNHTLKLAAIAAALSSALVSAPSFAADATAPDTAAEQAATVTPAIVQPTAQVHQKTRAEVYQELVDAEKSGELARENAMYAGG